MELRLIGYWTSYLDEDLPNPSNFVVENWSSSERELVINYLKNGTVMPHRMAGLSWCRFNCGIVANGSLELTDGHYLWPEGLAHYVEFHNLKLPQEFIENCKSKIHSEQFIIDETVEYTVNTSWWLNQEPLNNHGPTSFIIPSDFGEDFIEKNYSSCIIEISVNDLSKETKTLLLKLIAVNTRFTVVELFKLSKEKGATLELSRSEYESLINLKDSVLDASIQLIKYKF